MEVELVENKGELVYKLLCKACLCVGRSLHEISDLKIKQYYLGIINEIPLGTTLQTCIRICWECDAMIKKCVSFREQVQDCHRILQTYTHENLHECLLTEVIRPPRLRVQCGEAVAITPKEADTPTPPAEVQLVYVKDEAKAHTDYEDESPSVHSMCERAASDNDSVADRPSPLEPEPSLHRHKKAKKRKKTEESKLKKVEKLIARLASDSKVNRSSETRPKRIRTVHVSYDEMMQERDGRAARDAYLSSEYKCEGCLLGFHSGRAYRKHVTAKHDPKLGEYVCPICACVMATVDAFTVHYKRHMRRYECTACGKRTADMKTARRHHDARHAAPTDASTDAPTPTPTRSYECAECGQISKSAEAARYHRDGHKARVQCPDCAKTFRHRGGLLNHRLAMHERRQSFPCGACPKVFRWRTSLRRHLAAHHHQRGDGAGAGAGADAGAYCAPCNVTFASLASYQRHLKNSLKHVTQDQLRYTCDECGRRFSDKTKLRDHIEEKHLHRVYHCHICHKQSKNRVGLDQHVRNVHRSRPNNKMCHHCGKGFPTKVQLESHIRTHTGEKPFICEYCPTTFSQQSNLYKHNRQVHLNLKSKPICKKQKEEVPIPVHVDYPPPPPPPPPGSDAYYVQLPASGALS